MICEKNAAANQIAMACGVCRACRLEHTGNHPDLLRLTTDKATWTIKSMRQLFKETALTAHGHRRVVIIDAIEKVSLPAANALLKSLEEPHASTSFILTTRWPTRLLPTILSRCAHIHLRSSAPKQHEAADEIDLTKLTAEDLSTETLEALTWQLQQSLRANGPTPQLRRAYARLRDYYFITSRHGNSKLAGEVLLLSLPLDNGMS
jgi:DNA polymerase III delta prime subunit